MKNGLKMFARKIYANRSYRSTCNDRSALILTNEHTLSAHTCAGAHMSVTLSALSSSQWPRNSLAVKRAKEFRASGTRSFWKTAACRMKLFRLRLSIYFRILKVALLSTNFKTKIRFFRRKENLWVICVFWLSLILLLFIILIYYFNFIWILLYFLYIYLFLFYYFTFILILLFFIILNFARYQIAQFIRKKLISSN